MYTDMKQISERIKVNSLTLSWKNMKIVSQNMWGKCVILKLMRLMWYSACIEFLTSFESFELNNE